MKMRKSLLVLMAISVLAVADETPKKLDDSKIPSALLKWVDEIKDPPRYIYVCTEWSKQDPKWCNNWHWVINPENAENK